MLIAEFTFTVTASVGRVVTDVAHPFHGLLAQAGPSLQPLLPRLFRVWEIQPAAQVGEERLQIGVLQMCTRGHSLAALVDACEHLGARVAVPVCGRFIPVRVLLEALAHQLGVRLDRAKYRPDFGGASVCRQSVLGLS